MQWGADPIPRKNSPTETPHLIKVGTAACAGNLWGEQWVVQSMRLVLTTLFVAATTLSACKGTKASAPPPEPGSGSSKKVVVDLPRDGGMPMVETTRDKMVQAQEQLDVDGEKLNANGAGSGSDGSEYVPAEFKAGMSRWKDTGVYVDGKPVGFLTFGELPIGLKPTWLKDKVSAEKRPGTDDPGWRWAQQRVYKFTDYLKAVGIEPRTVKEIHVYGAKLSETIVATGKDLVGKDADEFWFHFGANTYGKAIPHVLNTFGNGRSPDKVTSVLVYLKKKPPTLVRNDGLYLDGVKQEGVPYYGEPIRGGVRVYLDDKLATVIKRQDLDVSKATKDTKGELHWNLKQVLEAQGVDVSKVQETWLVRSELRQEHFPAADLATMTFTASSQAKGGIIINDGPRAQVIALHTRRLDPSEIPAVTADDD